MRIPFPLRSPAALASASKTPTAATIHTVNRTLSLSAAKRRPPPRKRRFLPQPTVTQTRSMVSAASQEHPEEPAAQAEKGEGKPPCAELPPLTPEQYRAYDRLAVSMEYFHEHFRRSWNILYSACETGRRPLGMSLKQFIDEGLSLARYLTLHHDIEEAHIFPVLARKMPEFRHGDSKKGGGGAGELIRQHEAIHKGMDVFESYLRACRGRECELELSVLKQKMDSWGAVLLRHLDQEVETLRAENMRRYWTLDEVRAIPM